MLAHLLLRPGGRPPGHPVRQGGGGGTSTSSVIVFWVSRGYAGGEVAKRDKLRSRIAALIPAQLDVLKRLRNKYYFPGAQI